MWEEKRTTSSCKTYKPAPARALNGHGDGIEILDKVLDGPKVMLDGIFQRPILENTTVALGVRAVWGRCEVLPEEGVVDVTTAVESNSRLKGDTLFRGSGPGIVVLCSIEGIDICFVVLVVVQSHYLRDDVWLERIVAVREIGEGVCAGHCAGRGTSCPAQHDMSRWIQLPRSGTQLDG